MGQHLGWAASCCGACVVEGRRGIGTAAVAVQAWLSSQPVLPAAAPSCTQRHSNPWSHASPAGGLANLHLQQTRQGPHQAPLAVNAMLARHCWAPPNTKGQPGTWHTLRPPFSVCCVSCFWRTSTATGPQAHDTTSLFPLVSLPCHTQVQLHQLQLHGHPVLHRRLQQL
jgi:hypothetical protein